jgi:hypothetical protein
MFDTRKILHVVTESDRGRKSSSNGVAQSVPEAFFQWTVSGFP